MPHITFAERHGREEGLKEGLQKGRQEGRQEGAIIGKVQLLQQMLGLEVTATESLAGLSLSELKTRFGELDAAYRSRFKSS